MNVVYIKEVSASVIKNRIIKFDVNQIGNEETILEININDRKAKIINGNNDKLGKSKNVIQKMFDTISTKLYVFRLKRNLMRGIKKYTLRGYCVVFSKGFRKKQVCKYIEQILKQHDINEYVLENNVEDSLEKYIEEFKAHKNLKDADIRPLIVVSEISNLKFDMIDKLNGKYKELGIFCCDKVNNRFKDKIRKINTDCGSCIQIISKKSKELREYNVCIFIDKSREECSKYKFNKKACYIDFTNSENDKFNKKYLIMKNYIKQGKYDNNKVKQLFDVYGKNTFSNSYID